MKQIKLVGKIVGKPTWMIIDWEAGVVVCELGVIVEAAKQGKYYYFWS